MNEMRENFVVFKNDSVYTTIVNATPTEDNLNSLQVCIYKDALTPEEDAKYKDADEYPKEVVDAIETNLIPVARLVFEHFDQFLYFTEQMIYSLNKLFGKEKQDGTE